MKELYNAEYYKNNCGLDYSNKNHWGEFFGYIADKIIADLNPRTVLDAGCAWGYLVAALRDRGVEAYGVDISDYAISKVREDIRPYCMVCSLTEPLPEAFPERYDLVISIEVLEHMYEDKGLIAIRNLCNYSDVILFSSTPDDIDEATHFNVQQPEYWVRNFAKFNFFNQQDYTPSYISDSAMLFHRSSNIARIAEDYQRNIRMLKSEISKLSQYQSENSFVATLYFDYGRSFQAENAIYVQSNTTQFFQEFNIEQGVKAVRFDPVDGRGCIVQNLEILSNNGSLTAINLNGIKEDQFHYFVNTDPQLLINFDEQPIRWVRIKANILTFENIAWFTLLSKFKVLRDKETKIALALVAKEAEVKAALKAKDADTREILSSKDNIIEDYRQLYESVQTELQEYKKNYEDLYVQKEDFKRQLTEVTTSYQIISTSACWKLTEPIRVILDLIKKVRRLSSFTLNSKNKAELFYKGITNIKNKGIRDTLNKVKHYQKRQEDITNFSEQTGSNIENSNLNDLASFDSEYQENQDFKVIGLDVKTIAFFLPQFHTFPENEEWWGKGFTEWVNTKKARPRFKGHYQPREPHPDIGYYDLSEVEALSRQVKLAKQHGIYGFCFYYYWFSGKRLMEKPVDLLLNNPDLDFPFCFCWANENWTRAWDGLEKEIIMKQQYKDDDADKFILELKRYIDDKRYIRINGKPVIIVYNPGQIPHIENVFTQWRKKAKELGIGEILIWTCQTANNDAEKLKINSFIDAEVEFPPHNMWNEVLAIGDLDLGGREANIFNYQMLVDTIRHKFKTQEKKSDSVPVYRSCMLGWDNAARRANGWTTYYSFSLKSFYEWMLVIIKEARKNFNTEERFIFVNAWNEWAEGTYLEPDKKYGYSSINTLTRALLGLPFKDDFTVFNRVNNLERQKENYKDIENSNSLIAVHIHLYYTDVIDETISNLNNIPFNFDCFISTNTKEKAELISKRFTDQCNCSKIEVEIYPNRGRDIAPFLRQMKGKIDVYKYICHIHAKKTKTERYGDDWRKYLSTHLLGSKEYIIQLLNRFESDPKLGIVFPETYPVLQKMALWGGNKKDCKELLNKLAIDIELPTYPVFPVGNMFWARTEAIKAIFEMDLQFSYFPIESGQVNGTIAHHIERIWVYIAKRSGFSYLKAFNNCLDSPRIINKKRIAFYAHYDQNKKISDEDIRYIQEISKLTQEFILMTNSELDETELEKVRNIVSEIIKRPNIGFDFGAWKEGIFKYGLKELTKFDQVILLNNSCYGPVYDIAEVFAEMDKEKVDFWGITLFPHIEDGSYINKEFINEHVQSYFQVFNQEVVKSSVFKEFWERVDNYNSLIDVIAECETKMTKVLTDAGFSFSVYIKESEYMSRYIESYAIPYELPVSLLLLRHPFIKKKSVDYISEFEKVRLNNFLHEINFI